MSDSKITQFPNKKKPPNDMRINVRDIECLALLTNKDEQFYIDDPSQIAQIIAFMQQRGIKWKMEMYPGD